MSISGNITDMIVSRQSDMLLLDGKRAIALQLADDLLCLENKLLCDRHVLRDKERDGNHALLSARHREAEYATNSCRSQIGESYDI